MPLLPWLKSPLVTNSPLVTYPVTVYIFVEVGFAVGLLSLVLLNPSAGDQKYKSAPLA